MKTVRFQTLIDEGVLQIGDGYRAKMEELNGTGYPFLRGEAVLERHIEVDGNERFPESLSPKLASKLSHAGDTVVTTKGNSTGRAAYVREDLPTFVYSPHLSFWRSLDHNKLHPGFLREWAHGPEFIGQLNGMKDSTDMAPYLSLTDQRRLQITLPSGDEQRAIARVLGALDDKIELNRRMNRTLEELAATLFRSWFVDFDPVVAKAAGRKPAHLRPGLASLFPAHFQDSKLGPIPQGWRVARVGDEATLTKGVSYRSSELAESDVALVTLKSIHRGGGYRADGLKPYTGKYSAEQVIQPGELIVSQTDVTQAAELVGRAALVGPDERFTTLVASLDILIVRPRNSSQLARSFFYALFRTDDYVSHVVGHANGTTVLHLDKNAVPSFQFARPPREAADVFQKIVEPLHQQITHNARESRALAVLRDTLLPKLLSGQLRVKQAEQLVAAAS